jgi:hypothetical protein
MQSQLNKRNLVVGSAITLQLVEEQVPVVIAQSVV